MRERMARRKTAAKQAVRAEPTQDGPFYTCITRVKAIDLSRYTHKFYDGGGISPQGYLMLHIDKQKIGKHRLVLYREIGPGWHRCHHCGRLVTWDHHHGVQPETALVVDHLDWDRLNNDPANLVPACNDCNARRQRPLVSS